MSGTAVPESEEAFPKSSPNLASPRQPHWAVPLPRRRQRRYRTVLCESAWQVALHVGRPAESIAPRRGSRLCEIGPLVTMDRWELGHPDRPPCGDLQVGRAGQSNERGREENEPRSSPHQRRAWRGFQTQARFPRTPWAVGTGMSWVSTAACGPDRQLGTTRQDRYLGMLPRHADEEGEKQL